MSNNIPHAPTSISLLSYARKKSPKVVLEVINQIEPKNEEDCINITKDGGLEVLLDQLSLDDEKEDGGITLRSLQILSKFAHISAIKIPEPIRIKTIEPCLTRVNAFERLKFVYNHHKEVNVKNETCIVLGIFHYNDQIKPSYNFIIKNLVRLLIESANNPSKVGLLGKTLCAIYSNIRHESNRILYYKEEIYHHVIGLLKHPSSVIVTFSIYIVAALCGIPDTNVRSQLLGGGVITTILSLLEKSNDPDEINFCFLGLNYLINKCKPAQQEVLDSKAPKLIIDKANNVLKKDTTIKLNGIFSTHYNVLERAFSILQIILVDSSAAVVYVQLEVVRCAGYSLRHLLDVLAAEARSSGSVAALIPGAFVNSTTYSLSTTETPAPVEGIRTQLEATSDYNSNDDGKEREPANEGGDAAQDGADVRRDELRKEDTAGMEIGVNVGESGSGSENVAARMKMNDDLSIKSEEKDMFGDTFDSILIILHKLAKWGRDGLTDTQENRYSRLFATDQVCDVLADVYHMIASNAEYSRLPLYRTTRTRTAMTICHVYHGKELPEKFSFAPEHVKERIIHRDPLFMKYLVMALDDPIYDAKATYRAEIDKFEKARLAEETTCVIL